MDTTYIRRINSGDKLYISPLLNVPIRTVYRAMVISLLYAIYQHYIQRTPVQVTLVLQLWNTDVSPQIVQVK